MNIYDEAIEYLKNGSDDLYSYQVLSIKKALEHAKKEHELLRLYQKAIRMMVCIPQNETYHYVIKYTDDTWFNSILNQIKKLEEELMSKELDNVYEIKNAIKYLKGNPNIWEMSKERILKELQEFHECFYDESKANTAELKRKRIEEYIKKSHKVLYEVHEEKLALLDELEGLKRYPTADEVCEALSEYYDKKVIFKENVFWYKTIIYGNEQWVREVSLKDLSKDNRGDLITLIGRFYEGLEELE